MNALILQGTASGFTTLGRAVVLTIVSVSVLVPAASGIAQALAR